MLEAIREIVEWLRQKARPYLFSNTLAPPIVAGSIEAISLISESTALRDKLEAAGLAPMPEGLTPHSLRHAYISLRVALGDDAEARLKRYAYDYMKVMGDGVGDWAAGAVTCCTPSFAA